jgi:arabinofuranosyltransferase
MTDRTTITDRKPTGLGLQIGVAALVLVTVVAMWWSLRFLTDDAFIYFRYASNAWLGRGLVWNPAPFQPVEGCTSLAWTILLWLVWEITGVEPPVSCHWMGLTFGLGTLGLLWISLGRVRLPVTLEAARQLLRAVTLLGIAGNRVFATWLSSGLETSVFMFTVCWWSLTAVGLLGRRLPNAMLATAATAMALTRPDGLLAVAATFGLIASRAGRKRWLGLWPMLGVVALFVWRQLTYGEWLPNPYFAKAAAPWPEAGLRYWFCFTFENGTWAWLLLALALVVRSWFGKGAVSISPGSPERQVDSPPAPADWFGLRRLWLARGTVAAVGVLVGHWAYYTFRIGGDHFEYRVYAHIVPVTLFAAVPMVARLCARPITATLLLVLVVSAPQPIAALLWHDPGPLAPRLPALLQPLGAEFDAQQKWLREHFIGWRHHTMVRSVALFAEHYGTRAEGAAIAFDERPVVIGAAMGVLGWVLPHVAVIDSLGLNDWVIARTPVVPPPGGGDALVALFDRLDADGDGKLVEAELLLVFDGPMPVLPGLSRAAALQQLRRDLDADGDGELTRRDVLRLKIDRETRKMAHERSAPPGYLEGFRANVRREAGAWVVTPRVPPLSDAEIVAHELAWRVKVRGR